MELFINEHDATIGNMRIRNMPLIFRRLIITYHEDREGARPTDYLGSASLLLSLPHFSPRTELLSGFQRHKIGADKNEQASMVAWAESGPNWHRN